MSNAGHRPSARACIATAQPLLRRLIDDAAALRLGVETPPEGCTLVDAGIDCAGGIEAGLRIAEICMGGLGSVSYAGNGPFRAGPGR